MVNLGWNASTAVAVNGTAMGFHSAMPKSATSSVSASTLEDGGINGGDFEEIGLDDTPGELSEKHRVPPTAVRSISLGNGIRRPATIDHATVIPNGRELTQASQKRAGLPSISTNVPTPPSSIKESRLNLPAGGGRYPSPNRTISRSPSRKSTTSVNCPPSPATSTASQNSPPLSFKQRSSWQGARKKTIEEIEAECDDSDDEIPDDAVFWNVPISPRLGRSTSSLSASPERYRNMLRSDAPGTKPRPQIRGNSTGVITNKETRGRSQGRAKSWNDAIQELGDEARELSEALERHADEELEETSRRLHEKIPKPQKPAVRPHTITLPPLQVTNGLIDPLPISKEKEAVLSRTRPSWLPPKSKKEEEKHLREYKRMMEAAQEAEKRRQEKERKEQEIRDKIQNDLHQLWDCEILPNWAKKIKEPNTRELWWRGVAPRCRGIVWAKAIGNSLHITAETYKRALKRAKELEQRLAESTTLQDSRERKMYESIRKDVTRAFPELKIFQEGAPLHDPLVDVLFAYSTYRSDIGYVHGIHTIAAILLLNLSAVETFIALANILNRPIPLAFLTNDTITISKMYSETVKILNYKLPALHTHLHHVLQLPPQSFLEPLMSSLFTFRMSIDAAARLWDVYVFEGDTFLPRAAIGIITCLERGLYGNREEVLKVLGWAGAERGNWVLGKDEDFVMQTVRGAGKLEEGDEV